MTPALIHPSRRELFAGFCKVGITAFGGALPLVRRMLVEERRWINDQDFLEYLGLGQVLPGPNVLNIAIAIGMRFYGIGGALAAAGGLMLAPLGFILLLAEMYDRFAGSVALHHLLGGLASVAAGLMAAMGIRLAMRLKRVAWRYLVAILTFAGVAVLQFPLLAVLLTMAPFAIILSWHTARRERRA
jgi:chromate transporter